MISLLYNPINADRQAHISLPSSKSISNRALIIQALLNWKYRHQTVTLSNLSKADDTLVMQHALESTHSEINLKNAGTCFRFLTAYFALTCTQDKILTGSERLKQRPISGLVDALLTLGASIEYLEKEGYAPLLIKPAKIQSNQPLHVATENSSQFLSSMVLIAPFLETGIEFEVDPNSASFSYVLMTLGVLKEFDIKWELNGQQLIVFPIQRQSTTHLNYTIEADWSSAAFFYGVQSILQKDQICINGLQRNSIQGDQFLMHLAADLGIASEFSEAGVCIHNIPGFIPKEMVRWNFSQCPDLAPVLIMAAVFNFKTGFFTGLENLNYKESQRLLLLNDYLNALGITTQLTEQSLEFVKAAAFPNQITANTAHDHRMVMCLTLLSIAVNSVYLNEIDSVEKSFPEFWDQANKLGFCYSISK